MRHGIARYALAVVAVAAAWGVAGWTEEVLNPPIVFLVAVSLVAWYAGLWPAVAATLLSTLTLDYFFFAPLYSVNIDTTHIPRLVAFSIIAACLATASAGRRRVERTLHDTQLQQADLLNLTHDTVFVRDMNDVIQYWNRGAAESYGWPAAEALGRASHELMHTVFPESLGQINGKLLRDGRWEGELVHTTRDGRRVVVASRWSLQRGPDGKPKAILETNNDVTTRRAAEDALRDSKEQWQAVFENNPTMYFMLDRMGNVLSVNPFGAEQLGYTVDELVGHPVALVFRPEDHETLRAAVQRCLSSPGRVFTWEIRKVRKDGTAIWVRETANAMRRTNADPIVLIACEDVTPRKHAEAELRHSERRYRHIFEATGASIWEEDFSRVKAAIDDLKQQGVTDFGQYLRRHPEFVDDAISLVGIVDVNDATLKLFGAHSKEELLESLATVFTPDTRDVFAGELIAIAEQRPLFEGETTLQKLTGERVAAIFSVSFPPPDAPFDAVMVSIMDITDRKRAEQELEELAGRLIHAQEEERRRMGRELHDHISQMLGVLTIRIDELRASESTPPSIAATLHELRDQSAEITNDIHNLSHRLHSSALDYLGLMPAVQKLVNESAARHGIPVTLDHVSVPPLPSDVALCLFRVVEESLTNIAKHSRATAAHVRLQVAPDGLHLMVEDNGTGFQADRAASKAGLGFVSMRERLRLVRGTLRVSSAQGRGTSIDVFVPASRLQEGASAEALGAP